MAIVGYRDEEIGLMPHLPPDVPVRYSLELSVFLITMCALSAAIMAAVGSINW